MSSKPTKIDRGSLQVFQSESLIRLEMYDAYFDGNLVAKFFVPASTVDRFGFVPDDIVRSRLKHDFNIEVGHYSTCMRTGY